jgi:hypothetical protein
MAWLWSGLACLAPGCTRPAPEASRGGAEPIPLAGSELFTAPSDRAFASWPPPGFAVPAVAAGDELPPAGPTTAPPAEPPGKLAVRQAREALGRLDFDAAEGALAAAIEADPGYIPARYELARARALRRNPEAAVEALTGLADLARTAPHARQLLDEARVDPDFKDLRSLPAFRELTGATLIRLTWTPGDAQAEARAQALAATLERGRWEVRLGASSEPAAGPAAAPSSGLPGDEPALAADEVRVPRGDAVAARVVKHLSLLAGGLPGAIEGPAGSAGPGIEIRLAGSGSAGLAPPLEVASTLDLATWHGVPLTARSNGAMHTLTLRPTGFFSWRIVGPAGRDEARSGRFALSGSELRLQFKAVVETPAAPDAPATTETRSDLALALPVSATADALRLGDLRFIRASQTP